MTWWALVAWGFLAACGENTPAGGPALSLEKALLSSSEMLEYESLHLRQLLWEELLSQAQEQACQPSLQPLFPTFTSAGFVAKEGPSQWSPCLEAPGALSLKLDERREAFSDIPREEWRGLSERDIARCLALHLLSQWHIQGEVSLQKVAKSPYAAAYVEGSLRLNSAFVLLAASSLESAP